MARFAVFNIFGHAHKALVRRQHQITARQGNVHGYFHAFGTDGVFDHLHHNLLAFFEHFINVLAVRAQNVGNIQIGVFLIADIGKRTGNAGQDVLHRGLVNIAHDVKRPAPLPHQFIDASVFQNGDARFFKGGVDDNLYLRRFFGIFTHNKSSWLYGVRLSGRVAPVQRFSDKF